MHDDELPRQVDEARAFPAKALTEIKARMAFAGVDSDAKEEFHQEMGTYVAWGEGYRAWELRPASP